MNIKQIVMIFLVTGLAACSPKVDNRGYVSGMEWKDRVIPGQTTKDEVQAFFGSPSSQSIFGNDTWYYITQRKETTAFLPTEVAQQHVVRIEFDSAGVVSSVQNFSEQDAKDFDVVKRTTPTEGHTLGFFEQVVGNIGRFNRPGGGSSPSPGRRSTGGY